MKSPYKPAIVADYFTLDQKIELKAILGNSDAIFRDFHWNILEAIQDARKPEPTQVQKQKLNEKALESVNRLITDLQKCDLWWEILFGPGDDRHLNVALTSIRDKLLLSLEQAPQKSHRTSKYFSLAAEVGSTMAWSGLKVSGYYNDTTYDPPHMGNAAKVIKICIAAAGLPPSRNLKQLAQIAAHEAKLGCK